MTNALVSAEIEVALVWAASDGDEDKTFVVELADRCVWRWVAIVGLCKISVVHLERQLDLRHALESIDVIERITASISQHKVKTYTQKFARSY